MSHEHNIADEGNVFVIDASTRAIKRPADVPRVVQGDHNSERISFSLNAKVIEGHNMAECDRCEIHFTNFNPETDDKEDGVYEVKDLAENDGNVTFSWKIGEEATQIWGALSFSVKFLCFAEDGTTEYEWNTLTSSGIPIYPGKDNVEAVLEKYPDFIEKINKLVDILPKKVDELDISLRKAIAGEELSPTNWFAFTLNDIGTGYSVKANFDSADKEKTEIVIPYEYNGLPVTTINPGGFSERGNIVRVVIPNTVTAIGSKAFQGCTKLQKVILPKSIEVLSDSMFEGCASLKYIDLPNCIKEIQYDVFRGTSIEYMDLPYGITYIGETLFAENTKLRRVNIPDTVTSIGARAFYKCTSLKMVVLPRCTQRNLRATMCMTLEILVKNYSSVF